MVAPFLLRHPVYTYTTDYLIDWLIVIDIEDTLELQSYKLQHWRR